MSRGFDRAEVEKAFRNFDTCVQQQDWEAAADCFAEDAMGGNVRLGVLRGRRGLLEWMRSNPAEWGYESLWIAVDPPRVVNKWRHWLPGTREDGSAYAFEGLTEYVYAGEGRFSWGFTTPDLIAAERVTREWQAAREQDGD